MRTAISLPDEIFGQLDAAARRRGVSRSSLIASALEAYFRLENADRRRAALQRSLERSLEGAEPGLPTDLLDAARRTFAATEW